MFKSLDLIESFGSGVGKAKRAMTENGSDGIHYQEYDENIDITSVLIPISKKFFDEYFKNRSVAYAYKLGKVKVYDEPKSLIEFGLRAAPQSFAYTK